MLSEIAFDLGLVLVLVAPDPRAERPACGQAREAGHVVVELGDIERAVGGEQVELEPVFRAGAGAEDDVGAVVRRGGHVEGGRVGVFDEQAPAARADHERHRDVRVVVAALRPAARFELHRADVPAVVHVVVVLAQAVEALLLVDHGAQAEVGDGVVARVGHQIEREAAGLVHRHVERGVLALGEVEAELRAGRAFLYRGGLAEREPGEAGGREVVGGVGRDRQRVVVEVVVDGVDATELDAVFREAEQHVASAHQRHAAAPDLHRVVAAADLCRRWVRLGAAAAAG